MKKYCVAVMGIANAEWFNSKLLTEEFETLEEAEKERDIAKKLLKLEDKNMLILEYMPEQRWVKQLALKG